MMLYKYVDFTGAKRFLTTLKIRLTQPSDFNDPFELHPEFQLMSREDIAELPPALDEKGKVVEGMRQLTPEAMQRMMSAILSHLARMSPIHSQHPGATFAIDNNAAGRDFYDNNFGILSLTETPDNVLMWAHYGNNHKGIAIGFDENHDFFKGDEVVAGLKRLNKVDYNQKRPVLSPSTQNNPKVFLRKSVDWAYEREWRLIRPLKESSSTLLNGGGLPIYLFDVPLDAVRMIITGSQMIPEEYQEICKFCAEQEAYAHIRIHHALLSKEEYAIEIHPALTEQEQQKRLNGKVLSAKSFDV